MAGSCIGWWGVARATCMVGGEDQEWGRGGGERE